MVLSLLFFVVPGIAAWTMERRGRRKRRQKAEAADRDNPSDGPETE